MRDDDFHVNWRINIVLALGRYRVTDKAVRECILTRKIYICERNFKTEYIEFTSTQRFEKLFFHSDFSQLTTN